VLIRLIYLLMVRLFCWPAVPAAVPGSDATRLSTAFDPVALYGRDPGRRPDINGKVGASGCQSPRSTTCASFMTAIQMIIDKEWGLAGNENPLQGSFVLDQLADLVEEAVLAEFDRISERGGILDAMETGYQRGKIQDESMPARWTRSPEGSSAGSTRPR
jgi:methylmalonyl-CoA mutase N-terminal domain/subunit